MSSIVSAGERFGQALSKETLLQMIGVEEPGSAGVGMVLYPLSAFRAISRAAQNAYTTVSHDGHQKSPFEQTQTRDELHDRIGQHNSEQELDALFASKR
ncbi:2-methylisocitrate lyase [Advenella kashmirensis WT001]|uniref:2-methylisocitrate lyase n=1 Tax=Advenella kashmirensis (strain DSM 17095 / LMG 22695 / WT001) TaxID=1036672 RepID=I3UE22_ADVKW|nr:2-methylisocitrate lyase [Advenella kashmirensis WT001]